MARNMADRQARAARLTPEVVAHWTRITKLAADHVRPGAGRPCAHGPWDAVLGEVLKAPPFIGTRPEGWQAEPAVLVSVAADIAQPGWPEPRRNQIEFALGLLEADVMLFRSSYAKRHLIRKLKQSPLTEADVARIEGLLRRAVLDGSGLEEARAWRKLAARLVLEGRLPRFREWLDRTAQGAILTIDKMDRETALEVLHSPDLSESNFARFGRADWCGPAKWGLGYPERDRLVPAGALVDWPGQRAIERDEASSRVFAGAGTQART